MEPFKNEFSYPNARRIAEALKRVHPAFSIPRFSRGLEAALEPLELKQRMQLIADRIEAGLPAHPPEMFSIFAKSLAKEESDTRGLRGFLVWPLSEIVARRGLAARLTTSSDWDASEVLGLPAEPDSNKDLEIFGTMIRFGNHEN